MSLRRLSLALVLALFALPARAHAGDAWEAWASIFADFFLGPETKEEFRWHGPVAPGGTVEVKGVNGTLKVGKAITAELTPFQGATGKPTALHDTIFTTIPGSPAYVGKATNYVAKAPGFDVDMHNHNAVSGSFRFQA